MRALILSLVPGWGHVYWGREALGLGLFTAFAVAAFALVNGLFVYLGEWRGFLIRASAATCFLITVGTWIDLFRRTSPRQVRAEEEMRERHLREGTVSYLRGDLDQAKALFLSCVRLDPFDVEALFRLGVICARTGDLREATAWLKRTRRCDLEEKWRWEVGVELKRLKALRAAPRSRQIERDAPQGSEKEPV